MSKKAKLSRKIPSLLLALVLLVVSLTVIITSVSAAEEIEVKGAMSAIKAKFDGNYLAQPTVRTDDDFTGKLQYTVYYDMTRGKINIGHKGTPIILYSINHPTIDRVGTDEDTTIIQSMLDRGYVVVVVDYLMNYDLTTREVASSTQQIRVNLRSGIGNLLSNRDYFPEGTYPDNYLAPAGCNVSLYKVFWEIDKHSAEGTLEKIVENWNSDFRVTRGKKLVKWATGDTVDTRKAVQNDFDGNAPVWYNASGKEDANGLYTYVRFTKAVSVTDCVNPDGSFIDMNLYIHIVYPTKPNEKVPVMALANSTPYPTTTTGADSAYLRQHSNDFLYNGYANVVFDYLFQPMARSASWGYYDGSQGNTKDHMNYGLMMYNDKLVNTAAMRYIRYTSLSGGSEYNFDLDNFGVYGNSKGGWFSFLGEKVLQTNLVDPTGKTTAELEDALNKVISSFVPDRYYKGHHGETRYQVGAGEMKVGETVFIKAAEMQPWLTYKGKEILSGCQLTNACNGSQEEDITADHAPIFISGNMTDDYNAAYSYSVNIYNICRELDIPLLHFEVPIGHTLTEGQDMNYNVDTYDAYFRYLAYYLKDAPISVSHISPMNNAANVKVTDKITVYFAGAVTREEITKVTVTSANSSVQGKWESSFGGTTWTFTPDALEGSTLYTVTVPADLKGDNGVAMGKAYTSSFLTELDKATATNMSGSYHTLSVPYLTDGNSFVFRFLVDNDAVNVAELYAVSAVGETEGEYLGSTKVNGNGSYEIDITEYAVKNIGKEVVLYLKTAKTASNYNVFTKDGKEYDPFDTYSKDNSTTTNYKTGVTIDGETAFEVSIANPTTPKDSATGTYPNISYYYSNVTSVFTYSKIVGSDSTAQNEGKRFIISFDIYDTADRVFEFRLKTMTSRTDYGTIDYDNIFFNVKTKANEWTHVEFTYDVYEPKYGFASEKSDRSVQYGEFCISPTGDTALPVYFNNLKSIEVVTELDVKSAVIAEKSDGTGMSYTAPVSTAPFALYNGSTKVGEYAGWKSALAAYKTGYTVKLQSDYTFTDSDFTSVLGNFATVDVELSGYTITSANTKNSLLHASATNTTGTTVNVTGGAILLSRTPLISYESSSALGSGKKFNFNLNGTYIGFVDNAFTTEVFSAKTAPSGVTVNSNISLNGCTVDLPDANHAHDAFAIFSNPTTTTLNVKYSVTGGQIKLTSQRWATISENATIVEFFEDNSGNYTTLVMPLANTYEVSGSYLNKDGYALYKKSTESDNMVTYVLEASADSTRYGVITDTYKDAGKYPFLVFMNGNLLNGHDSYKDAIDAAATALKGAAYVNSEAQVYVRANFSTPEETSFGSSAGTIVVDLNGYTMLRDKNPANMVVNSNVVFDYATGLLYKNGRIEMNHSYNSSKDTYSAGLLGATHVLKEDSKVKTWNVTYEGITFGFADGYYSSLNTNGLLWAVWQNGYGTNTITNLTLTDCVFDFTKNVPTGQNLIIAKGTNADFNIAINGGEIKGDASAFSLVITDAEDNFTLGKNSKGEYLKLASGAKPTKDNFLCDDGIYRSFQEENGSYVFKENLLSTKYGLIPEANGNDIFVLFSDGEFVSGHNTWASATQAAGKLLDGKTDKEAQLLMRKDYTNTNDACNSAALGKCNGMLTIDLGGKVFTRAKVMFDFSYQNGNTATANVIIKNGTLLSNGSPMLANQISGGGTTATKTWNVTIEDVTFGFAASAKQSGEAFWASWVNPTKVNDVEDKTTVIHGSQTNLTINNCTFDLQTVVPPMGGDNGTTKTTLFDFSDNKGFDLMKTNLTINGGKILANNLSNVTLFSVNSSTSDKITFGKLNGEYITMTTPTTAKDFSHYTGTFNTAEGVRYFVETLDDGTNSYYELLPMTFGEFKANVAGKYLSAYDYPFFVFSGTQWMVWEGDTKGSGNSSWKKAIDAAVSYVNDASEAGNVATIILRRDYDISTTNTDGTSDAGSNFSNARGKIVLDLNGYTMNNVNSYLVDGNINYTSTTGKVAIGYASSLEIKNGTLKNSRTGTIPMIGLQHYNNTDADDTKVLNFVFNNVRFELGEGSSGRWIDEFTGKNGDGIIANYTMNGCTFDLTNGNSSTPGFRLAEGNGTMVSTLVINGGNIIVDAFTKARIFKGDSTDTLIFGKLDGKYTTLTQLTSSAAPTVTFKNASGTELSFGKDKVDGQNTVYLMGEPIATKYGILSFMYQSVEDYPFVAFDANGKLIKASAFLYGPNDEINSVMGMVKEYLKANVWNGESYGDSPLTAYILMRRNYKMASNETFNNLAQVQGLVTIDLNGFTLTTDDSKPLFPSTIKPWSGSGDLSVFGTYFELINGEIKIGKAPLITVGAWMSNDTDVSGKPFVHTFTNVKFTVSSTASSIFMKYYRDENTPNAIGNPELNFNNCTFDLTNAKSGAVIFNLGNGYIHTSVTVNGGEIIAKNADFIMFTKDEATTSNLVFTKSEGANYTTLTLSKLVAAPEGEYDIEGGKAVFVKISETADTVTYRLRNAATVGIDYTPKTSITLGNELVMNVYIPVNSTEKFTFNDAPYENLAEIENKIVTIDGKNYYHFAVALGSSEAAKEIKLVATVAIGEETVTGTFTFSIPKYASKVIANGNAIEKQLATDVLAYIRAAYNYEGFKTFNSEEEIARVNALIDSIIGDYSGAPVLSGTTNTVAPVTSVTLNLDAKPTIRFYTSDTSLSFYANGKKLNTGTGTDSNGAYVELNVYAYALCETITYTGGGSYHISDFVNGAVGTDHEALVKAFVKYTESAAAYRNSVVAVEN